MVSVTHNNRINSTADTSNLLPIASAGAAIQSGGLGANSPLADSTTTPFPSGGGFEGLLNKRLSGAEDTESTSSTDTTQDANTSQQLALATPQAFDFPFFPQLQQPTTLAPPTTNGTGTEAGMGIATSFSGDPRPLTLAELDALRQGKDANLSTRLTPTQGATGQTEAGAALGENFAGSAAPLSTNGKSNFPLSQDTTSSSAPRPNLDGANFSQQPNTGLTGLTALSSTAATSATGISSAVQNRFSSSGIDASVAQGLGGQNLSTPSTTSAELSARPAIASELNARATDTQATVASRNNTLGSMGTTSRQPALSLEEQLKQAETLPRSFFASGSSSLSTRPSLPSSSASPNPTSTTNSGIAPGTTAIVDSTTPSLDTANVDGTSTPMPFSERRDVPSFGQTLASQTDVAATQTPSPTLGKATNATAEASLANTPSSALGSNTSTNTDPAPKFTPEPTAPLAARSELSAQASGNERKADNLAPGRPEISTSARAKVDLTDNAAIGASQNRAVVPPTNTESSGNSANNPNNSNSNTESATPSIFATDFSATSALAPTPAGIEDRPQFTPERTINLQHSVGSQAWKDEIANNLVMNAARQGEQKVELILNPEHLGRIEVAITINNDQASASFASANPAVREAIEDALPRLREMMANAGINLGQTNVGSDTRPNASQEDFRPSTRRGSSAVSGVGGTESNTSSARVVSNPQGLVDTFV